MEIKTSGNDKVKAVIGILPNSIEIVPQEGCVVTTKWSHEFDRLVAVVQELPPENKNKVTDYTLFGDKSQMANEPEFEGFIVIESVQDIRDKVAAKSKIFVELCGSEDYADRLHAIWNNASNPVVFVQLAKAAGYTREQIDAFLMLGV